MTKVQNYGSGPFGIEIEGNVSTEVRWYQTKVERDEHFQLFVETSLGNLTFTKVSRLH